MVSFETFYRSIEPLRDRIIEAQLFDFMYMSSERWSKISDIFFGIKVMTSRTSLVGNCKGMHHMIPNIIPPIDREYTLKFLIGNTNIKNDLAYEWQLMQNIISDFFIPVASDKAFQIEANRWMAMKNEYPWDTSIFKVVDNLIIGLKK